MQTFIAPNVIFMGPAFSLFSQNGPGLHENHVTFDGVFVRQSEVETLIWLNNRLFFMKGSFDAKI